MPSRFTRRILEHLRHDDYEPAQIEQLAQDLDVDEDAAQAFAESIKALVDQKRLTIDPSGKVKLPIMPAEVMGSFKKNPKGFGFVKPDMAYREGDLFIPPDETGTALTGDRVRVEVVRGMRKGESDTTGRILEVLTRKRKSFTGELHQRGGKWLVFPDGKELTEPIVVPDAGAKHAKVGDKVVVELLHYPEGQMLAEGVVVRVLGEAGLPDVETQAVIAAYNLPGEFTPECVEQAREATAQFDEEVSRGERNGFEGREDLRSEFIITIDPPDAKDYDDAISIKKTEKGWELAVHIADVANFILPGTPLDDEAKERGNSVYLPRLVIPMLPELLSNGICSLQEGVIRFCKSAFMRYDKDGNCTSEGAAATVIKSAKRLTYLEAQALIDGDLKEAVKHAKTEPKYTDHLIATLREMNACSRAIRDRRKRQGMIHLELPEVVLIFDELGHVVDAQKEDDAYTHTLIEMFMVEANEVLARLFQRLNVPVLRRIHPEPTPGDVGQLQMYARVAGYKIPKSPTREELQGLLEATAGTAAARAVHMAVLRTMTKAEYSPALVGHFALASEAYAHFTSPIRRYADTLVHRALTEYLKNTTNGQKTPKSDHDRRDLGEKLLRSKACPDYDTLVQIGQHITRTEENAADAEHSLRGFLVLQLLSNHVGEIFDGIVTGVTQNGVFIQLDKYLADGMIKSADLPTGIKPGQPQQGFGRWKLDPRSGALVNEQSGRSYNIGDRVQVQIAAIDLALRRMDLMISDGSSREAGKSKKVAPSKSDSLGGGGLNLDWDVLKSGRTGADKRAARSKSRERGKQDFRKDRKDKGKGQ
ncbi:MAG: VacB/RNase II family 3'-5' exoribonuclease [Pyrinomonadaceae bacterium]|nr:VacB/RNase II family 3'-5' exoribonuclease [Phycisphaerales bacterium]